MKEKDLWIKINSKKNSHLINDYLKERVSLERFNPSLVLPLSLAMIGFLFVFNIFFFSSGNVSLSIAVLVLLALVFFEIVLYVVKKDKLIEKYVGRCE